MTDVMQDVFGWKMTMTGPNVVHYESAYLGIRVGLSIESFRKKRYLTFTKQRRKHGPWDRFETAQELLDSFPKIAEGT